MTSLHHDHDEDQRCSVCNQPIWCDISGEITPYVRCGPSEMCTDCHADCCDQRECLIEDIDPLWLELDIALAS